MRDRFEQESTSKGVQSSSESSEPCQFYMKIGACRHGDKCSRIHTKPSKSNTILIKNLYRQAKVFLFPYGVDPLSDAIEQSIFEDFYEEVYSEIGLSCGKIREMHVCENHGAHLNGNVYVKFYHSSAASRAVKQLSARFFAGSTIDIELSPVHDFVDASCRQHQTGSCARGGICNFMHVKEIRSVIRERLERSSSATSSTSLGKEESRSRKGDNSESRSEYTDCSDEEKRRKRVKKDKNEDEDKLLPSKYQVNSDYISSEETSSDSFLNESLSEDSRATPKAFRTERYDSEPDLEGGNENEAEPEEIQERRIREIKKMQIIRHRRWSLLQTKLKTNSLVENYDSEDEGEKNYVFSLL